jgi:rhodanese-related sulfurtransferase
MGTLVVMRYSTNLFANLADHTYVKCGTGAKAWGCWGGKTGGTELRRGTGSTNRADAIAESYERAKIKCYLINGVCHQAANRILLPAGITVRGARGYDVSEALFGTYGRPRGPFGTCLSPFDQHPDITGDLPECIETRAARQQVTRKASTRLTEAHKQERKYIKGVLAIYGEGERAVRSAKGLTGPDLAGFHLKLFMYKAQSSLGAVLDKSMSAKLLDIRRSAEWSRMKVEDLFTNEEMKASEFVNALNKETILFQEAAAGALKPAHYKRLFGLKPGDTVILADPRIVKQVYGDK